VIAAAGFVPALAAESSNQAGPIGLVVIVVLGVALVFLARSMIRHLKRVPASFDRRDDGGRKQGDHDRDGDGGG
jgi:hypothetical protein